MVIFPLAPDQTIAQMWSNGARGETTGWMVKVQRHCKHASSGYIMPEEV